MAADKSNRIDAVLRDILPKVLKNMLDTDELIEIPEDMSIDTFFEILPKEIQEEYPIEKSYAIFLAKGIPGAVVVMAELCQSEIGLELIRKMFDVALDDDSVRGSVIWLDYKKCEKNIDCYIQLLTQHY